MSHDSQTKKPITISISHIFTSWSSEPVAIKFSEIHAQSLTPLECSPSKVWTISPVVELKILVFLSAAEPIIVEIYLNVITNNKANVTYHRMRVELHFRSISEKPPT
jgi:hypothetical protein